MYFLPVSHFFIHDDICIYQQIGCIKNDQLIIGDPFQDNRFMIIFGF